MVGEVHDNNETMAAPAKVPLGRVRVKFPGLSDSVTSDWAPCAAPMAGPDRGFYALPDKGDQVLVAFEHGDLSQPYVHRQPVERHRPTAGDATRTAPTAGA